MKGYFPVDIPTKKYIRAYIYKELTKKPLLNNESLIGNKLFDLLQHHTNEQGSRITSKHYDCTIRVYVSKYVFDRRGANLNATNVKNFNLFLQHLVKLQVRFMLDLFMKQTNSITQSLAKVREEMQIDIEDWDCDSIKKDYYRWRHKKVYGYYTIKKSLLQVSAGQLTDA
jgi:hypothetical protein